jgi:hypothetical protein
MLRFASQVARESAITNDYNFSSNFFSGLNECVNVMGFQATEAYSSSDSTRALDETIKLSIGEKKNILNLAQHL